MREFAFYLASKLSCDQPGDIFKFARCRFLDTASVTGFIN
jgi:hypothetical protein